MVEFRVLVSDKEYTLEFTRGSVRQFEDLGGSIQSVREKMFTSINQLFFVGLMKHHAGMNYNLAQKIADSAINEWGASDIYTVLVEKFSEVLDSDGGAPKGKKSFLISEVTTPKKT